MKRRPWLVASLVVAVLPLAIVHPAVFGDRVLIPFDHRVFPPESLAVPDAELEELRASANFDITEKTLVNAPEIRLARSEIARGRFPGWDPYARGGAPLFANVISGLGHLPNLPHLLMEPERAFAITAWLNAATAGLLMLGLLRELGAGWQASLFGAVAFAWSGTMAARIHLYPHYGALLWLPGMLWAIERVRRRGGAGPVAALALCTLLTWTAGYPPAALSSTLVAGAWLAAGAVGARGRIAGVLGLGAAGFAIGLGLAAYVLVPMAAFFLEVGREADAPLVALRRAHALDFAGWLNFVLEAPFSTPSLNREGGVPHGTAPLLWLLHSRAGEAGVEPWLKFTEHRVYLGALPLLALPFALLWRPRRVGAAALLGTLALLVAAAGGGAFDALCAALPPMRYLQPMEVMPPVACLLAVAAALGFARLFESGDSGDSGESRGSGGSGAAAARRTLAVAAAAIAVAMLGAAAALAAAAEADVAAAFFDLLRTRWGAAYEAAGDARVRAMFEPVLPMAAQQLGASLLHGGAFFAAAALCAAAAGRRPRLAAAAAIAVTTAELVLCALPLNRCHAPTPPGATAVHAFLRGQRDRLAEAGGFTMARVAAPRADDGKSVPEVPLALPPNTLLAERIRDLNAYTFLDGRSHLPFRRLYESSSPSLMARGLWLNALPDDERLAHPLLDLFGVRYLLCHVGPDREPPRHAGALALPPLRGARGELRVYERAQPCPRAFVVPRATVCADDAAILDAMVAPDFAPRERALLTRADWLVLEGFKAGDGQGGGDVRFALDEASHVVVEVRGSGGGLLLLADTYFRGWSVSVNGAPAPCVRADLCLRAVPVPPGDAVVDFRYAPPGLLPGVGLSLLTALAASWLLALLHRARARRAVA
jgi:hypothetical protein